MSQPDNEFNMEQIRYLLRYFQPRWEIVKTLPDKSKIQGEKIYYLESGNTYIEYRLINGNWCTGSTFTKGS